MYDKFFVLFWDFNLVLEKYLKEKESQLHYLQRGKQKKIVVRFFVFSQKNRMLLTWYVYDKCVL